MTFHLASDDSAVDWTVLADVFERAPLGRRDPRVLEQLFRNSQVRCFAWEADRLIGAGRALTDWINWAVIFDLVVLPEHQGRGCGRAMMELLVREAGAKNAMLHSTPGMEPFYATLGYRRMRTAMALFADPRQAAASGYVE